MIVQCQRCILDSTFPHIHFDENGVCNYCKKFDELDKQYPINAVSEQKIKNLLNSLIKNKKSEYDCIIGVSGGRDSTYCLYLLKKWGLNPLAVHFDNNMDSKIAAENIKNACRKCDTDLFTFVVDWDEYKDLQVSFLKASVPAVDIPMDQAYVTILYNYAADNNIPNIITGHNFRGEGFIPPEWSCNDVSFVLDIQKKHGNRPLVKYPLRKITDLIRYKLKNLNIIAPLNYIDYRYDDIMPVLENKLGWKWYGGHHFECIFTRWAFAYYLPKKFGIDKRVTDYSALVRSHQMKREDALEKLKEIHYSEEQEREDRRYISSKLGLSDQDLGEILLSPPRANRDYQHDSRTMRKIKSLFWLPHY